MAIAGLEECDFDSWCRPAVCVPDKVISKEFARVTYTKAIEKHGGRGRRQSEFCNKIEWRIDSQTEQERLFTKKMVVALKNYPVDDKAFTCAKTRLTRRIVRQWPERICWCLELKSLLVDLFTK